MQEQMQEVSELKLFFDICNTLIEDGTEKYGKAAYLLTEGLNLAACSIWGKEHESLTRLGFHQYTNKENLDWLVKLDYKVASQVFSTGREVFRSTIDPLLKSINLIDTKSQIGIVSLPILHGDETLGVINFWVDNNYSDQFSNYLARVLSNQVKAQFVRAFYEEKNKGDCSQVIKQFTGEVGEVSSIPNMPGLSIAARFAANRKQCGCFFDFFPDAKNLGLGFGEVTGQNLNIHSFKLAARMVTKSLVLEGYSPDGILNKLSNIIFPELSKEGFLIGQFFCSFDGNQRVLEYSNGGHIAPILVRASTGKVENLDVGGSLLGLEENNRFMSTKLELCPGDVFICYSRGLIETINDAVQSYDINRLVDVVNKYKFYNASSLLDYIFMDYHTFLGNRESKEDVAILVIKVED